MARQEHRDNGLGQTKGTKKEIEALDEGFEDLDFAVHKSRRYHEKLAAFYAIWRDLFRIITVIAGSGAFVIVMAGSQHLAEWLTGFVGLWAILDLVIRPDKKHDLHSDLRVRFTGLASKIQQTKHTNDTLRDLTAERLLIEQNEPPCKRLVDIEARNDEIRARGWDLAQIAPLTPGQQRWGYYGFTWGLKDLENWKAGISPIQTNRLKRLAVSIVLAFVCMTAGASALYFASKYSEQIQRLFTN